MNFHIFFTIETADPYLCLTRLWCSFSGMRPPMGPMGGPMMMRPMQGGPGPMRGPMQGLSH